MSQSQFHGPRVGIGFDYHPFSDSGILVLGGLEIPGFSALHGFSDGDVLSHALMDAILGAAGEVDRGTLYPDTDETYKETPSIELARQVVRMVRERGFCIVNIDAVLVCTRPRISTWRPRIRTSLARAVGIDTTCVNLKGKSGMKRDRQEDGVEATAVALLAQGS